MKLGKSVVKNVASQEDNWDKELTKIMMESQTRNIEDAPEEVYAFYNLLIDESIGLEE